MKKTLVLVLAAASACLLAALPAQANFVLNPGFETGLLPPWVDGSFTFGMAPATVVLGHAHSGTYALEFSANTSSVYQYLTLAAVPTVVDFWAETTGAGTLQVMLDSQLVTFKSITGATGYTEYNYTVTPTAGSDQLTIQWGYFNGPILYLDDVSVTQVPEPTTMIAGALLLLPFGASTLRILRKNRAA